MRTPPAQGGGGEHGGYGGVCTQGIKGGSRGDEATQQGGDETGDQGGMKTRFTILALGTTLRQLLTER